MKYLLAHDLGTSGNKATLFSENGDLIVSYVEPYPCKYFNNNWAEQNPNDYWNAVCKTSKIMAEKVGANNIEAVSFSGQMMACICVDSKGDVLRPSIIWADQRANKQSQELASGIDSHNFFKITGHRNSASYSLQKIMWVKENEPDIYKNTYKFLNCKDYIINKLTGTFLSDYTDAAGTNAFDLNSMKWSGEILKIAQIDINKMPDLFESTHVAGIITASAAKQVGLLEGTVVVVGGGDGATAAAGAGSTEIGKAYCCLGSSAWVSFATSEPYIDREMQVFNWPCMKKGLYNPCGTMQSAGVSYSWMRDNICRHEQELAKDGKASIYELINNQIAQSQVGSNGLLFLPYLMGERSPRWNPDARGAFIGLKAEHQRKDILRSVMEGVTLNLAVILDIFRRDYTINEMTLIGGGAKSKLWTQIIADCFNVDILIPNHIEESSSMGAAIAAGIGIGMFDGYNAINKFQKIVNIVNANPDSHEKYAKILPLFNLAYSSLCELYKELAKN